MTDNREFMMGSKTGQSKQQQGRRAGDNVKGDLCLALAIIIYFILVIGGAIAWLDM